MKIDTKELERLAAVQKGLDPTTAAYAAVTRRRASLGRALAKQSEGTLGWCAHHQALEMAETFNVEPKRASGLRSYCITGEAERRQASRDGVPTPKQPHVEPPAHGKIRDRKCRKCEGRFVPPEGDKVRVCPACRERKR